MFRKALPTDQNDVVRLFFLSNTDLMDYVFAHRKKGNALAFLQYAYETGKGFFGYEYLQLIENGEHGIIALEQDGSASIFYKLQLDTLSQIFHFYGYFSGLKVAFRYFKTHFFMCRSAHFSRITFIPNTTNLQELKHFLFLIEHKLTSEPIEPLLLKTLAFSQAVKDNLKELGYRVVKKKQKGLKNNFGKVSAIYLMEKVIFNFKVQY